MFWFLIALFVISSFGLIFDLGQSKTYSPSLSFNVVLDNKMKYYPYLHKMRWLKLYMNVFLPLIFVYLLWVMGVGILNSLKTGPFVLSFPVIMLLLDAVLFGANVIVFREFNKISYRLHAFANFFALVTHFLPGVFHLLLPAMAERGDLPFLSLPILTFYLLPAAFLCMIIIPNHLYIKARKELFFKNAKQLRAAYGSFRNE